MNIENFICKSEIKLGMIIEIPENAQYLRMKKGHAFFYVEKGGKKNGFIQIPEDSANVSFPEYRRNAFHIMYGEPAFQK